MEKKTRAFNSMRNISIGIVNQVIILLLGFASRTIFINALGAEYLGISGLFSNILMVLSLAELGIGNAMMYALYKPIAKEDKLKIAALMQYYKKLYRIVAAVVACVGVALVPFLSVLVKTDKPVNHLTIYYILYVVNSVLSYLFAFKAAIINADQKMYLTKIYSFAFYVLQFVLQTMILLLTHSFIWYLVMQLLCTLGNNVFTAYKADKLYPYIRQKQSLDAGEKRSIFNNIKSLFLYKIGGVILNNTDNILISVMIGTVWVGYYSNYYMIINALLAFVSITFTSMNASVGNLHVSSDTDHKYQVFNYLNLSAFWIAGFCSVCLFVLLNDFITLWIGKSYLLDPLTVIAIIANFYMVAIFNPVWLFRDSTGLFKQTKYVSLCTAALNILLSIVLGQILGISGILLATAISRICTNFWFEPLVLFQNYFKKNSWEYFIKQAAFLLLLLLTGAITYVATMWLNGITVWGFLGKLILCLIIPNAVFFAFFRRSLEFQYIKENYIAKILNHFKTAKK